MMFLFLLGAAVIFLLYCILCNWRLLGALIMGVIGIGVVFAVGLGALILLMSLAA
jgi:hypothetical protein